jgi:hypothetical protein
MVDRTSTTSPYRVKQRLAVAGLMIVLGGVGGIAATVGGGGFPAVDALRDDLLAWVGKLVEMPPDPPAPLVVINLAPRDLPVAAEPTEPPPPPSPPKIARVEPPPPPPPKVVRVEAPPPPKVVRVEAPPPPKVARVEAPTPPPEPESPGFARVERLFAPDPENDGPVRPQAVAAEARETPPANTASKPPPAAEPPRNKPLVLSPSAVPPTETGPSSRPTRMAAVSPRPPTPPHADLIAPRAAALPVIPRRIASIFGAPQPTTAVGLPLGSAQGATAFRPNDVYGWNGIPWGSTNHVLEKAFGRQIAPFESGAKEYSERFDVDHVAPNARFGNMSFNIVFQMSKDTKQLRQVLVDGVGTPSHGDFEAVMASMVGIYGRPASLVDYGPRNAAVDRPLNIYKKAIWKFPTTTIQLTVMAGPIYFRERKGWLYLRYFPTS